MRKDSNTPQKFWSRVAIKSKDECWLWTGYKYKNGYGAGRLSVDNNKITTAHRISWRLCFGDIPEGLEVGHRCSEKACVNPAHIYLSSRTENMREVVRRDSYLYPQVDDISLHKVIEHVTAEKARWELKHKKYDDIDDSLVIAANNILNREKHKDEDIPDENINEIMICGHPKRYIVSSNEGTGFCLMCEYNERNGILIKIEKAFNQI